MYHSHVIQAIATWVQDSPDRPALQSAGKILSYSELWKQCIALAERMQKERIHCAGLMIDNGIAWCIADLAAIIAEVILIPIPPFFTEKQKEHALGSADAECVITYNNGFIFTSLTHLPVSFPADTAKITYTSGTTGTPKGVYLSQDSMEHVALSLVSVIGNEAAKRHLAILPLPVLLENVAGFYTTMLAGGCYVVEPLASLGFRGMQPDGASLLNHLAKEQITSCILVPEYLHALIHAMEHTPIALPHLQFMAVGGAKVSVKLLEKAQKLGLPVYQGYGLSESASVVAVNTPQHQTISSVGKILPHISYHIAADGELILKNPALLGHKGEYATGDLVRMDKDGFLFIEGRKRNVIITAHGRNISPEWPESELLAEHGVAQVVVIGEAEAYLTALVVPSHEKADIEQAVQNANARLPEYAQIGAWKRVEMFTPQNQRLTTNGRVIRQAVMEHYCSQMVSSNSLGRSENGVFSSSGMSVLRST